MPEVFHRLWSEGPRVVSVPDSRLRMEEGPEPKEVNDTCRCLCRWEGSVKELEVRPNSGGRMTVFCPRSGHAGVKLKESALHSLQSTCPDSAEPPWKKSIHRPIRFMVKEDLADLYGFTDGSSTGSYAAVLIDKEGRISEHSRHVPQSQTRNVAAEIMAVGLALNFAPRGSRVVIVSDYMGTGLWLHGCYGFKCADSTRRIRLLLHLIAARKLSVDFIHHRGHQADQSDFTIYNNRADELCRQRPDDGCCRSPRQCHDCPRRLS